MHITIDYLSLWIKSLTMCHLVNNDKVSTGSGDGKQLINQLTF